MKKICMLTNWYPTSENPYRGVFFKEQAFALEGEYDFVVVRDYEHVTFFPKKYSLRKDRVERNTVEYIMDIYTPAFYYVLDIIKSNYVVFTKKNYVDGIGSYMSFLHKKRIQKLYSEAFLKFEEKIDYLYCVDGQVEAFKIQCISKAIHKPYIIGEHAPVPWTGRLIYDVNKYAIEEANLFLAISKDKIRQLMMQGINLPKTVYIGNLIDESKQILKKDYHKDKVLLIVAANSFYKNFDMFLRVMNRLNNITLENFKIMIVGYGANKGYSKDVTLFEERIKQTDYYEKVILIREVPHNRMNEIYSKADIFIMTSVQEGQPVSALEAACCGLPIFATRCGGVEDYINDEMGRLFDINDIEGMAHALKEYLEGKLQFSEEYIRKRVVSLYGREKFVSVFKEALSSVDNEEK